MKAAVKTPFDSLAQEAYLSLWRTYDRLRSYEDALFAEWGLTAQQYNVLRILEAASPDPVPTLRIAAKLISKSPDITRMLDRLEANEWIARVRDTQDRRAVLVRITDAGSRLLKKLADAVTACHQEQLGHLSTPELEALCELLQKAREPHEVAGSVWKSTT